MRLLCNPVYLIQVVVLTAIAINVTAQDINIYQPAAANIQRKEKLKAFVKQVNADLFKQLDGDNKKDKKEIYKSWFESVDSLIARQSIFYNEAASDYLTSIANEIVNGNLQLKERPFEIVFTKDNAVNAGTLPNSLIIINMGLLNAAESESQLAFVIAHEIAHHYLKHSYKRLDRILGRLNSKEMQEELRRIQNMEYGKRSEVENLVKKDEFSFMKRSREDELEADSLAFMFIKNTRYDVTQGITMMDVLDQSDSIRFDTEAFLKKTFDFPAAPFKKRWLHKEEGLLGGHAVLEKNKDADSLKTHPDCKLRKQRMQMMYARTAKPANNIISSEQFSRLKKDLFYESLEYPYTTEVYGIALYEALKAMDQKKDDPYVIALIGKSLNSLYKAQKEHKLSKVIMLPSPEYPKPLNSYLQFVQNLYLEDIAALNYHFLKQYEQTLNGYEEYVYALALSKKYADTTAEFQQWTDYYNKKFPTKKYKLN